MVRHKILFEWEDQHWFPGWLRGYMLDFLARFLSVGRLYAPALPLLVEKLRYHSSLRILDLASGGGGPLESLLPDLQETLPELEILLSDLYPNPDAWQRIEAIGKGQVQGLKAPVNALEMPCLPQTVSTMFSAMHHLEPPALTTLMKRASVEGQPILFCDGGGNRLLLLGGLLLMPLLFLVWTPLMRPFSMRRLLFTYVLPVIPFCTLWDGAASILRLYSLRELESLARQCTTPNYQWVAGRKKRFPGIYVYYLSGDPA